MEAQKVFELNLSRKFYRDSTRRWAERRLHPLASMCYVSRAIAPREPWRDSFKLGALVLGRAILCPPLRRTLQLLRQIGRRAKPHPVPDKGPTFEVALRAPSVAPGRAPPRDRTLSSGTAVHQPPTERPTPCAFSDILRPLN